MWSKESDEEILLCEVVQQQSAVQDMSCNDGLDSLRLTDDILELNRCVTFQEVNSALFTITDKMGFDAFLYRGRFQTGGTNFVERIESNYDPSWQRHYEDKRYVQIDPTVSHAFRSLCPLVWSDDMYMDDLQRGFQEEARQYGLAEGATFPVHRRNGDFALLNLSLSRSDKDSRSHARAMLTWGVLLAALTHEAVGRIVKKQAAAPAPRLTRRETEVLRWVADGKTNWEIARLMDISDHGVSHHVRNILMKFQVTSRHQAVAQAHVFGLL